MTRPLRPLRLHLVRHGETDWNQEGRIQGHIDVPLNDRGREQARALAEMLSGRGAELVLSSDLSRSSETAEIIATRLGVPLQVSEELRERHLGALQGLTARDLGAREGDPDDHARGFVFRTINDPGVHPEGGESLAEFRERVGAVARRLRDEPPATSIVVVSHGGAIRAILLALAGTDRRDVVPRIGNCSVMRVVIGADDRVQVEDDTLTDADDAHTADESLAS